MDTDSGPDQAGERESSQGAARHAYLVAAYDNYYVLERLLRLLDHEHHDIYLHVDEKARGFEPHRFSELCRRSRLVLMPRMSVYWGDYTQVESILRMMRRALAEGSYSYLHLLSDSDLPLRSSSELLAFFAQHQGQEFVEFGELTESKRKWVAYWYPFNQHVRSPRPLVRALYARGRRLSLALQRLTGVDRTEGLQGDLRSGSDWYSITAALATHVVSHEPEIRRLFRSTFIPTEFVIHTLIWNSKFRARTCDASRPHGDNLRLVDFGRGARPGSPLVWTSAHLHELTSSDRLFARKFSPTVDSAVIDRLVEHVEGRELP